MKVFKRFNGERNLSSEKFIRQDSNCPQIDTFAILSLLNSLGGQIQWSSTESFPQLLRGIVNDPGPSKIRYFNIVSHRKKDIFGFDVSVHDAILMQKLNSHTNLFNQINFLHINFPTHIKLMIKVFYQVIKVPICAEIHYHVKFRALFEKTPQSSNVWMLIKRHNSDLLN